MHSLFRRVLRTAAGGIFRLAMNNNWQFLRYYPHVVPDDKTLERWQLSEWPAYKDWIDRHSLLTARQWKQQHQVAKKASGKIKISIVSPVFNTQPDILEECIFSVRIQTSPFWELILIDDSSTNKETHHVLNSRICQDPRIRILFSDNVNNSGISAASNIGIHAARGEYIVFLDHDDRLAPEAIQMLVAALESDPELDIVYSDRDMLSPEGKRFMHLMKPDWSPDNLYAGNYIFHLMCYRKKLIMQTGGLRSTYDGSQDYDLILRCMEYNPKVKHIPQVLYHWRQHAESVAMVDGAKHYAFEAGMEALRDALRRRKIQASVSENTSLWRGNYQIDLPLPPRQSIGFITLPEQNDLLEYVDRVVNHPVLTDPPSYIFIHSGACSGNQADSARILASWLALENIGIASGCLLDDQKKYIYAGMTFGEHGETITPYQGYDVSEPGYMAVTKTARNISAPSPFCVLIRSELWLKMQGFDKRFQGPYALLDFALSAIQSGWRIVYVPRAVFTCRSELAQKHGHWPEQDIFYQKWRDWHRKGDPCYNPNLKKNSINYELA